MTTYSKETALYNTGAIGADIQEAGTTASKYLSSDPSGIMVYDGENGVQYPSTVSTGTRNVFIDDNSVEVRNGTDTLASFGENVLLGTNDAYHTEITSTDFSIKDGDASPIFSINSNGGTRTTNVVVIRQDEQLISYSYGSTSYTYYDNYRTREYSFRLYTDTVQTVTRDISVDDSSFTLTGYKGGRKNSVIITPRVYSSDPTRCRITVTYEIGAGTANTYSAPFEVFYNDTVPIPAINIGGTIYTDIGRIVRLDGSGSNTDITATANTSYTLGYITLTAGVWIISVRARFTPSASGAHVSQITISQNSTPTNTALDRLYAESTYFNQHNATFIVNPGFDEKVYYVHGTATVAGTWNRTNDSAFSITAVKIR